jgi:prepilin-type N-terminal cleavage/methylation domain-containing protein
MNKKRGMTIVEMLVTLAILGIVILMALGLGKGQIQRADFTSSVNQFVADLGYARQLASRENRYVVFKFNAECSNYTMMVQKRIGLDLSQDSSFRFEKIVKPLNGEQFVETPSDFAVNSMGIIYNCPVSVNSIPTTVTLNFIKLDRATGVKSYASKLTLFPSGGVKIERQK